MSRSRGKSGAKQLIKTKVIFCQLCDLKGKPIATGSSIVSRENASPKIRNGKLPQKVVVSLCNKSGPVEPSGPSSANLPFRTDSQSTRGSTMDPKLQQLLLTYAENVVTFRDGIRSCDVQFIMKRSVQLAFTMAPLEGGELELLLCKVQTSSGPIVVMDWGKRKEASHWTRLKSRFGTAVQEKLREPRETDVNCISFVSGLLTASTNQENKPVHTLVFAEEDVSIPTGENWEVAEIKSEIKEKRAPASSIKMLRNLICCKLADVPYLLHVSANLPFGSDPEGVDQLSASVRRIDVDTELNKENAEGRELHDQYIRALKILHCNLEAIASLMRNKVEGRTYHVQFSAGMLRVGPEGSEVLIDADVMRCLKGSAPDPSR